MKKVLIILVVALTVGCKQTLVPIQEKYGVYKGTFKYGNYSDQIQIDLEKDSVGVKAYFTSLSQNAYRIPFQNVREIEDSIYFEIRSDFFTYSFSSKWIENYSLLEGDLKVDSLEVPYTLAKINNSQSQGLKNVEVTFNSNGLSINGTVWYPETKSNKAIVIVTSSGNADRSASRSEAMLFAQMGYTCFHYDKRGTGTSEGNWISATMDDIISDDINAIHYFSDLVRIPFNKIGIKGSSQGAAKIPQILTQIKGLQYGIVVSCPGVTLLESDLNFWKNRNAQNLGNDVEKAVELERQVFRYIAGQIEKEEFEAKIEESKREDWYSKVWVPNVDEVQIDQKLSYSPVPYFEKTKTPLLILQGTKDEIIPLNSHSIIKNALDIAGNVRYTIELLKDANHSMYFIGKSDFPYWSKLHPEYIITIAKWLKSH